MSIKDRLRCEDCKWSYASPCEDDDGIIRCRRFPPQLFYTDGNEGEDSDYPRADSLEQICGEFVFRA